MTARWRHAGVLLLAALLPGGPLSAQTASGCDNLVGRPINFKVDWQTDIKPIINETISAEGRCTSCHGGSGPAGGLDLTDVFFDAIYSLVPAYVVPGRPQQSELFLRVNCESPPSGFRMPFFAEPLSLDQQTLIYDWIAQGAGGEPTDLAIEREFIFRDGNESLH